MFTRLLGTVGALVLLANTSFADSITWVEFPAVYPVLTPINGVNTLECRAVVKKDKEDHVVFEVRPLPVKGAKEQP